MQPYILVGLLVLVVALGLLLRRVLGLRLGVPKPVAIGITGAVLAIAAGVGAMYVFDIGPRWGKPLEPQQDMPIEEWERMMQQKGEGFLKTAKAMEKRPSESSVVALVALSQKLDLLDREGSLVLEAAQARQIVSVLERLEEQAQLSEDEARGKADRILGLLSEAQRQTLDSAQLPAQPAAASDTASGSGRGQSDGGNPFQTEPVAAQLKNLRARLAERAGSDRP